MNNIGSFINQACLAFIENGPVVEEAVLRVGSRFVRRVSHVMSDIYNTEGFVKGTKALGSNLKLIHSLSGSHLFRHMLPAIGAQKDLGYAFLWIGSAKRFIKERGLVNFLNLCGDLCEFGKYLQKNYLVEFSRCTHIANRLGAFKVCVFRGEEWALKDIPVLNSFFDTPKNLFVFGSSFIELLEWSRKCLRPEGDTEEERQRNHAKLFELSTLLKVGANLGKIGLIVFGPKYGSKVWFAVLDALTQDASFGRHLWDRHLKREGRFYHPGHPAYNI
jgi:hypothetical protein